MNRFRYWYLKHVDPERALEELRKPVDGNFVVIQDGERTAVRVRVEELEGYARYFKEKARIYADAYEKYCTGSGSSVTYK